MAVLFGLVIWMRQGESSATLWVSGFILELIFLIENVFVFHCVISAFKLSHKALDNALFVVVGFQVAFQVVFYMGLAATLTHWNVLPYVLGVWLLFVGYQAAFDDSHSEIDVMETRIVRGARWILGERLLTLDTSGNFMAVDCRSGKHCLTVGGLCVVLLVVADFMLEIDVTLAKIEGLGGVKIGPELEYICFSSSAVATFTVPELYFVAREIFARLRGLKYGIAVVIIYLGMQMLLGTVYTVPLIVDIAIFIGVLVASGITSIIYDSFYLDEADAKAKAKMAGAFIDDNADRNNRHTWNGVCKAGSSRAIDVRAALSSHVGSPKGMPEKDPEVVPEPEEDHPKPEGPEKDTADEEPLANESTEDAEAVISATTPARPA
jgi:tellurite resistance protein TerC